jgi:uncharacterized protein (TIGR02453 family)
MESQFPGFTSDSFEFFRDLARNNNKLWFDQNRERYERYVTGAFRGLLVALESFLLKLNPYFETAGKTNANFSRINRDIRFSKDKSPYKSNYYLYVFDRRRARDTDGRLYVGLSADCVTVGFAIYASWKKGVKSALETVFRKRFAKERAVFERLLEKSVRKGRYETYWYRQEKGDWSPRPGLPKKDDDWLTLQGWVVRKVFEPGARGLDTPSFAKQVEKIFAELYPLYAFTSVSSPRWKAALRP